MSIGTAILIVGLAFIGVIASVLAFCFIQFRKMEAEQKDSLREFEERREEIRKGVRTSEHRFKL